MSGQPLIFRAGTIGQSTVGGRKASTLLGAARHNKREIVAERGGWGAIDPARSRSNYSLHGPADANGVVDLARKLMANINTSPDAQSGKRRDYVQAIELIISLPVGANIAQDVLFPSCLEWVSAKFGAANLLCADVHVDEGNPHCHVLIAPIQAGKWVGGAPLAKGGGKALYGSFCAEVAAPLGLKVASDRLKGASKLAATEMVVAAVSTGHKAVFDSPLWPPLRDCIERNPAPFLEALGLISPTTRVLRLPTMAEIFTSTGKGPTRERYSSNAMGFANQKAQGTGNLNKHMGFTNPLDIIPATEETNGYQRKAIIHQSLSCVGFARPKTGQKAGIGDRNSENVEGNWTRDNDDEQVYSDQGSSVAGALVQIDDDGTIRVRDGEPEYVEDEGEAWPS